MPPYERIDSAVVFGMLLEQFRGCGATTYVLLVFGKFQECRWRIFEGFEFKTSCSCGLLETIQAVKFAPSGFWTGFTAMIRHGFLQHQINKGSTFRFEFDFDRSVVRLLVN